MVKLSAKEKESEEMYFKCCDIHIKGGALLAGAGPQWSKIVICLFLIYTFLPHMD